MALYRSLAPEHPPDAAIAIGWLSANDRLDGVHKLIVWLRRTSNPFKGLGDGSLEASGEVRSGNAERFTNGFHRIPSLGSESARTRCFFDRSRAPKPLS